MWGGACFHQPFNRLIASARVYNSDAHIFAQIFMKIQAKRRRGHLLTACNAALLATPNRLLNPKWPTGSWKRWNLRLLDPPINFRKISFCIRPFLLWEPQKSKMATRGPKMADGVYPQCLLSNVFRQEMFKTISYSSTLRSLRRSHQLSLNKLFDPSAPSMRKVDDRKRKRKEIIMSFLVATNVIASWPTEQRPTGTTHEQVTNKVWTSCE